MAETLRIEIPIETVDNTDPGVSNATKKFEKMERAANSANSSAKKASDTVSKFDKQAQKTEKSLASWAKEKYEVLLEAKERISPVLSTLGNGLRSFAGKTWSVTMRAIDLITSPVRGIINLLKNPIFQVGAVLGVSIGLKDTIETYKDFEALPDDKKMDAVEMDCVVGRRVEVQAILTLLFRRFRFQLMLFLPKHTQEEVGKALDMVERLIGLREFKRLFGVILTDRGSEFLDYGVIEKSCTSRGSRCRVYYCDPMKSGQKGSCEKNHVELRKVIPKGSSFAKLTPAKLSVVCSHVNSYGRPQFGGASPLQLASQVVPAELLDGLSIGLVPAEEVMMKPGLIEL